LKRWPALTHEISSAHFARVNKLNKVITIRVHHSEMIYLAHLHSVVAGSESSAHGLNCRSFRHIFCFTSPPLATLKFILFCFLSLVPPAYSVGGCLNMSKNARAECKAKACFLALLRRSRFSRRSLKERFATSSLPQFQIAGAKEKQRISDSKSYPN